VKELIREATEDEIPLTITWRKLADDEAAVEVTMLEVPTEPPTFEVRILPTAERVLLVVRLVIVAFVAVSVVRLAVPRSAP
jgi:hypothetical protein